MTALVAITMVWIFFVRNSGNGEKVNLSQSFVPLSGSEASGHFRYTHAYSIWLQPTQADNFGELQSEVVRMANKYIGTSHEPHATLYGPIYSTDETSIVRLAKNLATDIAPLLLKFESMDCKKLNVTKRWRSTLTIRYEENDVFTKAAKKAMVVYGGPSWQKPHSTMLYSFDGRSCLNESTIVEVTESLEKGMKLKLSDFKWTARTLAVYFTPLRDHWKSADDMIDIVAHWREIATFNLTGSP